MTDQITYLPSTEYGSIHSDALSPFSEGYPSEQMLTGRENPILYLPPPEGGSALGVPVAESELLFFGGIVLIYGLFRAGKSWIGFLLNIC